MRPATISDVQAQPGFRRPRLVESPSRAVSQPQAAAQCTTERRNEKEGNELGEGEEET